MRAVLLTILAAVMLLVMVLTWGSVGSAVMGLCLITMVSALLVQKYLTNRHDDFFQE